MKRHAVLFLAAFLPFGFLASVPSADTVSCPLVPANRQPTVHSQNIGSSETWQASKNPHLVSEDINITAPLFIEPCALVLISPEKTITVAEGGSFQAMGRAAQEVRIRSSGSESFARIIALGGGKLRLENTQISGGGNPLGGEQLETTGTIVALGADQDAPTQPTIFVSNVTVTSSSSSGLVLAEGAGFEKSSRGLTVKGSAGYPVSIWPRAVGTLPAGSYRGNAIDAILLPGIGGSAAIQEDATMRNFGVPYQVGSSLDNGLLLVEQQDQNSLGVATLTIEPGVIIRMKKGGLVEVQRDSKDKHARGALVAVGTKSSPIIFTSADPQPAAGDWLGIWFGSIPAANNKISFAKVEYAGGNSGAGSDACNPERNDAAIRIFGVPSTAFVTNTTIANSAWHGIDRGWSDDSKPSFLPTNTMTGIARCQQSWPRNSDGTCPADFVAPMQCWPQ